MKEVPGCPLPGPVVWSWGPACLYGCQIQPVCARISTRPTGCGSFRSSIGHEGLSTRRLGTPIERFFFFLALFITAVYMQHGKTNSLSVLEQIASRSLTLPASSDTHPSGVTSACLCICIVASCNYCGCTLSYFVQEQVRTVKKNPGKQALNELFYAAAC